VTAVEASPDAHDRVGTRPDRPDAEGWAHGHHDQALGSLDSRGDQAQRDGHTEQADPSPEMGTRSRTRTDTSPDALAADGLALDGTDAPTSADG